MQFKISVYAQRIAFATYFSFLKLQFEDARVSAVADTNQPNGSYRYVKLYSFFMQAHYYFGFLCHQQSRQLQHPRNIILSFNCWCRFRCWDFIMLFLLSSLLLLWPTLLFIFIMFVISWVLSCMLFIEGVCKVIYKMYNKGALKTYWHPEGVL